MPSIRRNLSREAGRCTGSAARRRATRSWTRCSRRRWTRCTKWRPRIELVAPVSEPWILAVDLGTGGPKTGAVSLRGEVIACAPPVAVRTTYSGDGGAVQDPADWWDGIRAGVKATLESPAVDPGALVGVGITGQWGSTVPVDEVGNAVGPCMLWADTRGGGFSASAMG